ncbi:DUF411 domain-containing protein [Primorskyibacter sp. S87]|uniref:DUF411 domain-containing protein n=1 Tax=Primorskyibacter sp. S87 TaxID=3415126 RepID=UPI003C7CC0D8
MNRRTVLAGIGVIAANVATQSLAASQPSIHVLKDPNCGCCSAWIDILKQDGFDVTMENSTGTALFRYKFDNGIPQKMTSCHTGKIDGYMIEGHVPPADIRRLLQEQPDAVGLAVPDMPYGSPGMGPESEREAYTVYLIRKDGPPEIFTHYEAA